MPAEGFLGGVGLLLPVAERSRDLCPRQRVDPDLIGDRLAVEKFVSCS
jgi:hypothetical protein